MLPSLLTTIVGNPVPYVATVSVPLCTRVGGAALDRERAALEPAIATAAMHKAAIVTTVNLIANASSGWNAPRVMIDRDTKPTPTERSRGRLAAGAHDQ